MPGKIRIYPEVPTPGDLELSPSEKEDVHQVLKSIIKALERYGARTFNATELCGNPKVQGEVRTQLLIRGWSTRVENGFLFLSPKVEN